MGWHMGRKMSVRTGMKLTTLGIRALTANGLHSDGYGLYLRVAGRGKSWIFRYTSSGKLRDMGLGSLRDVSLAEARALAENAHRTLRSGIDPVEERKRRKKILPQQSLADRVRAFGQSGIESKCSLYRHYDVDGNLLYVGISLEPLRRQQGHINTVDWRTAIFQIVIEPFATRENAMAAEEAAIRNEHPKHNTTHNKYRKLVNELKYLERSGEPKP